MKKLVLILFFYLNFLSSSVLASDKIVYIDVDFIMSNSKVGKYVSKKIEEGHKKNISSFKKIEDDLKKEEAKIVKKRSVLSSEDFQKEITKLREKANDYRILRKEKIDKITKQRLSATAKIIKELRPILAEYSDKNSISIIVEKKNIIIGKSELDVTKDILIILDEKINKIAID
tara:strand:+ start:223 stop:744 length:522 start_codon:yes stop_codon:yes gene_type:complete